MSEEATTTYSNGPPGLTYEKLLDIVSKFPPPPPWSGEIRLIPYPHITVWKRRLKRNARRKHKRPPHKLFARRFLRQIVDPSVDLTKMWLDRERRVMYCYPEGKALLIEAVRVANDNIKDRLTEATDYLALPRFSWER